MATLDPAERARLQHRTLRALTVGQVVGSAALGAAITVGAFVLQGILGDDTPWAGLAAATVTMGSAVTAPLLARRMRRRGRRPGLSLGYALAAVGGVVAAVGAQAEVLAPFLVGLFLYGSGQASNLLARYAATDLAEEDDRARSMSRVVFASTFGAVFGPLLVVPAQRLGEAAGLGPYTGPWLFSALFFALAGVVATILLRPDPLVVAGGLDGAAPAADRPGVGAALGVIAARPTARLAVLAMVVSQAVMVAVMAMTPVHLRLHGHEGVSQLVVSVHIAGMFAFSPLVGRFSDRHGHLRTIVVGAAVLAASTVLAAASGDVEQLLFPSLWALGLGWNFGLIGGSSLLIDQVPLEDRVGVQGLSDLLMSAAGGLAGFGAGFVRRAVGYHVLAELATLAAAGLLVVAHAAWRSARARAAVAVTP